MLEIPQDALRESNMCKHGNWKHCRFCLADTEQENPFSISEKEEIFLTSHALHEATGLAIPLELMYSNNFHELMEGILMKSVEGLPEMIGEKIGLDFSGITKNITGAIESLHLEKEIGIRSEKQLELLCLYLSMITKAQRNDQGFTPALAKELNGMDATMGCWSLKQKIESSGIEDVSFDFGYTPNQEVGVVRLADGKTLFVDTQTGFIAEIHLEPNKNTNENNSDISTYEITDMKPVQFETQSDSPLTEYFPSRLDIRHNGTTHWLGKLESLLSPETLVYNTNTAQRFRLSLENDAKTQNATRTIISTAKSHLNIPSDKKTP